MSDYTVPLCVICGLLLVIAIDLGRIVSVLREKL